MKFPDIPLYLAPYTLTLRAEEDICFPRYKGSTFRGAFGHSFRRMVCVARRGESCRECVLGRSCAYAYVFETSAPEDAPKRLRDAPRPFVIEADPELKERYGPGEEFQVNLVLIGKATELLPYFLFAFQEMGREGIGRGRGRFGLVRAESGGEVVYNSLKNMVYNRSFRVDAGVVRAKAEALPQDRITVHFLTPTRLKAEGSLTPEPSFRTLIGRLLGRLSALSYFHCRGSLWDYRDLLELAEGVEVEASEVRWTDWERYSSRQGTRMKLGGITGWVRYKGDLGPFLPYLAFGEYVHVGKGATFGLGRYSLEG